ncbi:MAG: hypothetical protein ACOCXJ_01625 [Planctomycetota bacterium]
MSGGERLERAARLLDLLAAAGGGPLRFGQLAAGLDGLNPASLSRLLRDCCAAGILVQEAGGYRCHPRVGGWAAAGGDLALRAESSLRRISARHRVTGILLERRGRRLAPVAKAQHADAPALMACGGSFPPRLAYFGSILLLAPARDAGLVWLQRQLADAPDMVDRSEPAALRVLRQYQRHGIYRDAWLYPGQLRLAVPIGAPLQGIIGAAAIAAACSRDAEAALLADLREAAQELAD